mmetsp:Transcript_52637/g.112301  ORF Transcript_52637/g.112301 Transcript_52637/m.112301 type:complete len:208 (-) Transcript_52637:498-1121(-)
MGSISQVEMPSILGATARTTRLPPPAAAAAAAAAALSRLGPCGDRPSHDLMLEIQAETTSASWQEFRNSASSSATSPPSELVLVVLVLVAQGCFTPSALTTEITPQPCTAKERCNFPLSSTTRTDAAAEDLKATKRNSGGSHRESFVTESGGHSPARLRNSALRVAASRILLLLDVLLLPDKEPHCTTWESSSISAKRRNRCRNRCR